jgi:hypothetical protein
MAVDYRFQTQGLWPPSLERLNQLCTLAVSYIPNLQLPSVFARPPSEPGWLPALPAYCCLCRGIKPSKA